MGLRGSKREIIPPFGLRTFLRANMAQLFVKVYIKQVRSLGILAN